MLCFILRSTSLLLKKSLVAPIRAFAFLIQAFTSTSSLSLGLSMEPRYLKLFVNWMCCLSGRGMLGGRTLSILFSILASVRVLEKHIASVLDLVFFVPTCICIPSLLKCCTRIGARVLSSLMLSVMKMLPSTKKALLSLKGTPWDVVGVPINLPYSTVRLPFLGS